MQKTIAFQTDMAKKKQIDLETRELLDLVRNDIELHVGAKIDDNDIERIIDIVYTIIDLREKYELGNFKSRDIYDEYNAALPLVLDILAKYDLYEKLPTMWENCEINYDVDK